MIGNFKVKDGLSLKIIHSHLPNTLQHGGSIFKFQLSAAKMGAVNDEGSCAYGSASEESWRKFYLKQVLFQPLSIQQGVGSVVQGEIELQGRVSRQAHLQTDLDFRLALANLPWKQPPGSFLWLLPLFQQVDHLDGDHLLPLA